MPAAITLTEKGLQQLRRDHHRLSYQVRDLSVQLGAQVNSAPATAPGLYAGKTTTAVTALSGNVPGTGTAAIYYRDTGTTNLTQREADGGETTVYNIGSAVDSGKFALFARDGFGDWWLVVVPC